VKVLIHLLAVVSIPGDSAKVSLMVMASEFMPMAIATTENLRQVSPTVKALMFLQMAAAIKGN